MKCGLNIGVIVFDSLRLFDGHITESGLDFEVILGEVPFYCRVWHTAYAERSRLDI